jgi:Lecithin retinol acyltransferase
VVKGDQIYVDTDTLLIKHHGIYMGDRSVIHFFRENKKAPTVISRTDIEVFHKGKTVNIVQHAISRPPDEVVFVAKFFLEAQRAGKGLHYDFINFNCEHLAYLCKTGHLKSSQVDMAFDVLKGLGSIAVATGLALYYNGKRA